LTDWELDEVLGAVVVEEPTPATPWYRPTVIVIMIEVTHGVWQPTQSGLAVMVVKSVVHEILPVQACSQKFVATPRDALAALE